MREALDRATAITLAVASALAAATGFAIGFVTTFTHRELTPWGLLAGIAVVGALVAAFRLIFDSRVIAAGGAVGAVAGILVHLLPGAGAARLDPGDWRSVVWALAAAAIGAAVVAWPRPRARREAPAARPRMDA